MSKTIIQEDLAEVISAGVNKLFKDGKVAYVGDEETPSDLIDFVSTGCALLDIAISNRPYGGIPFGRITEITGLEGSGKSLIAAHVMANVQKMGGVAVLIDTETAVNWEFFDAVGLDRTKNWVYAHLDTIEDAFAATESIIETVRKSSKDKPVVIVIDSIAGASTKLEMQADYERQGFATGKAIIVGAAMRKITAFIGREKIALILTNQLRHKMNAMPFSDPWTTSGGKAIAFASSVRLRLNQVGKIKIKVNGENLIIGVQVKARVDKNRLGPPYRTAEFDILFDRGISEYASWLSFLRKQKIVDGVRSNALTYTTEEGEILKFGDVEFTEMMTTKPELRDELYLKMCDTCIMLYKSGEISSDDIEIDKGTEE